MRFRMFGMASEFKTFFIPPHNPDEAAPGSAHPEMFHWPLEGFMIYINTDHPYDTNADPRFQSDSPWIKNEFNHSLCGKDMKKNVENYLLKHGRYGHRFILDEPEKAPLHLTGDRAAKVRKFLKADEEREKESEKKVLTSA